MVIDPKQTAMIPVTRQLRNHDPDQMDQIIAKLSVRASEVATA